MPRSELTPVEPTSAFTPQLAERPSRNWVFGSILALLVLATYSPALWAGFIWDDDRHITRPDLRSLAGLEHIWFRLGATQQYYPLIHSVFWMEHRLWGDWPLGYHFVNIVLQAVSALLLLKILRQLEVPGAWLAAAIFALHPVQVESVAWATELKNLLSGVFYFGSALAYLEFDRTRKTEIYRVSLFLFVLGLLSKSVIASLPAALLVVFWWKRGKLTWKQDVSPLEPFFAVGICSGLFTAWVERNLGAHGAAYNYTLVERGLIAGRAVVFYVSKLVWPTDLTFIYPRWEISQAIWWQYLFPVAVIVVVAVLGWLSQRWRGPLAGFLFFVGTLFPALGFFNVYPFRYSFVADHFQYLACLGIIVPFAAGVTLGANLLVPTKKWLQASLCAGLLLILAVVSWQRTTVYENVTMLWDDTLAKNPNCWLAYTNLGNALYEKGQLDEAIKLYQSAVAIDPDLVEAHYDLGSALCRNGQVDEGIGEYQKAVALDPKLAEAHYYLGLALFNKGQVDDAIAQFQETLRLKPNDLAAQDSLSKAQAALR